MKKHTTKIQEREPSLPDLQSDLTASAVMLGAAAALIRTRPNIAGCLARAARNDLAQTFDTHAEALRFKLPTPEERQRYIHRCD